MRVFRCISSWTLPAQSYLFLTVNGSAVCEGTNLLFNYTFPGIASFSIPPIGADGVGLGGAIRGSDVEIHLGASDAGDSPAPIFIHGRVSSNQIGNRACVNRRRVERQLLSPPMLR